jgi:hypothetical protein
MRTEERTARETFRALRAEERRIRETSGSPRTEERRVRGTFRALCTECADPRETREAPRTWERHPPHTREPPSTEYLSIRETGERPRTQCAEARECCSMVCPESVSAREMSGTSLPARVRSLFALTAKSFGGRLFGDCLATLRLPSGARKRGRATAPRAPLESNARSANYPICEQRVRCFSTHYAHTAWRALRWRLSRNLSPREPGTESFRFRQATP